MVDKRHIRMLQWSYVSGSTLTMDLELKPSPPEIPSSPPESLLPDTHLVPTGTAVVDHARNVDIATRIIAGQKIVEIALDLGLTDRHIRRVTHTPGFTAVYNNLHSEAYSDISKMLKDEKLDLIKRARAGAIRSQTLLAEIMDEIQMRIANGQAKATELKVGADTAFGIIDRSKTELSRDGAPRVLQQFNIDVDKQTLLFKVVREAGIDLSDLNITDVEEIKDEEASA